MNRDFKGIWIPKEIWLKLKSRPILQSLINYYYFDYHLDISDWKILLHYNLAKKINWTSERIESYLKEKMPQCHWQERDANLPQCSWCRAKTYRLQNHHHPISKEEGGKETVPICATCHDEFHFLKDCNYSLTIETIKLFWELEGVTNE